MEFTKLSVVIVASALVPWLVAEAVREDGVND